MPIPAILFGLSIAFAFATPPSIILTETIRQGARGGFRPALAVQFGSIVADAIYALLGLTGAAVLVTVPAVQLVIGVVGVGFMVLLGILGLRAAADPTEDATLIDLAESGGVPVARPRGAEARRSMADLVGDALRGHGPFLVGIGLGLANPWAVVFWLGVGGTLAAAGLAGAGAGDVVAFFVAYLVGLMTYSVAISALIALGHRHLDARLLRVVQGAAAVLILAFAVVFAIRVVDLVPSVLG